VKAYCKPLIREKEWHLRIPGITPCVLNGEIKGEKVDGKRIIMSEAFCGRFFSNKYIKCLHDICSYWEESYYILDTLIGHGIIKQCDDYSLEWTLNKTSLAWLFKKMHTINNEENYTYTFPADFGIPFQHYLE